MSKTEPSRRRAIIALVAVNLLWGVSFPAMKGTNMRIASQQGADAKVDAKAAEHGVTEVAARLTAACFLVILRFTIALVLLGVFIPRLFRGLTREQWWMGACTGFAFAAGFVLQIVGLNYVPASRSGFLTSLTVVFTPIVAVAIERRLPRVSVVAGVATALVGTGILTGFFELGAPLGLWIADDAIGRIGLGDWLTAAAAGIFTGQILLIDRFSRRMPAGQLTPGMFAATLVFGLIVFVCGHVIEPTAGGTAVWSGLLVDGPILVLVVAMSLFCTVLAFYWMNKYQAHVSPAEASIIYTLEPVFATLWSMFLPDYIGWWLGLDYASERPGWELVVGGAFVVAGNALALLPRKQ